MSVPNTTNPSRLKGHTQISSLSQFLLSLELTGMLWVFLVSVGIIFPSLAFKTCVSCSGIQCLWFVNSVLKQLFHGVNSPGFMSGQRFWRKTVVSRENREGCVYSEDDKRGRRGEKKEILRWNISLCGSKEELDPKGEGIVNPLREVNSSAPTSYVSSLICLFLPTYSFSLSVFLKL